LADALVQTDIKIAETDLPVAREIAAA